ncbi:hypothetical protein MRX96_017839 [Rhipicephalus microplus]
MLSKNQEQETLAEITKNECLKTVSGGHNIKPRRAPLQRLSGRASRVGPGALCDAPCNAPCNAPRNAANWAGTRFAETTTINSDSPDQLDCMDADDFEPTDNVGPSDSTPSPNGVAEASNNTYLRPSLPHTP